MSSVGLYLRLLRYVRPYWQVFAMAVLGMALVAAGDTIMLWLSKPLVNQFVSPDPVWAKWLPRGILSA